MLATALGLFSVDVFAQSIELGLPLACTFGQDCWIQQYFDHDAGKGVRDYNCGLATYDGHDGTDFRIQDTTDNAAVVASAPGKVRGVRDNMPDHLVRNEKDRAAVDKVECGNGVVIDHADGWQTQYCHMRKGSVAVKPGDTVQRGDKLGMVGYSGLASFPHVHLSVRTGGKEVDPFHPDEAENCGAAASLWSPEALAKLEYRNGDVIGSGFAASALKLADIEEGRTNAEKPAKDWPAMVFYGWAVNLDKGDTLTVSLNGPGGIAAKNQETLDRHKAQYFLFAGVKRPAGGWPPGEYSATFEVTSAAGTRLERRETAVVD